MKTRKILVLILALCMVFSLCACGDAEQGSSKEPTSGSQTGSENQQQEENSGEEDGDGPEVPDGFLKKEITIVVPVAAGGTFDMAARKIAELAKTLYDVDMIVQNVTGGGSAIGMTQVLTSAPDGYTIALYSCGFYGNVAMGRYDGLTTDMVDYLTTCQTETTHLCVSADSGIEDFEDLKEAILAGGFSLGGPGSLNNQQIGTAWLSELFFGEGVYDGITFVSCDGGARISADLMGDSILDGGLLNPGEFISSMEGGLIIPILSLGTERSTFAPDVPTLAEVGYENPPWFSGVLNSSMLYAPVGLDSEIREFIVELLTSVMNSDEFQQYIADMGATCNPVTGAELDERMANIVEYYMDAKETYLNGLI